MSHRKSLGSWGERYAITYLEARGYRLIAQNWRCSAGEIDLIMRDGATLVFIEVKTRRGRQSGTPEAAITPQKLVRLFTIISHYLLDHNLPEESDWRLDVVGVELTPEGRFLRCRHWPEIGADW